MTDNSGPRDFLPFRTGTTVLFSEKANDSEAACVCNSCKLSALGDSETKKRKEEMRKEEKWGE